MTHRNQNWTRTTINFANRNECKNAAKLYENEEDTVVTKLITSCRKWVQKQGVVSWNHDGVITIFNFWIQFLMRRICYRMKLHNFQQKFRKSVKIYFNFIISFKSVRNIFKRCVCADSFLTKHNSFQYRSI